MKRFSALLLPVIAAFSGSLFAADPAAEHSAIASARAAVMERENWPHGADFRAQRQADGWRVCAQRLEFPAAAGSARYTTNEFRVVIVSADGKVLRYGRDL